MPTIELESDVIEAVKARAIAWVDRTPSDTLRRLLGLADLGQAPPVRSHHPTAGTAPGGQADEPGRARKADLGALITAGLLQNGQTVYLRNYSGEIVPGVEAQISSPNKLVFNRRRYSMSNLAAEQLQKTGGYAAQAVRGPAHWVTEEGQSILDLWREYSRQRRQA